uniref:Structural maintenance of chromosomes protein n=1 Tax=Lates calcarifer TaxID=8187 RepID=A0A4W6G6X4_LATCA
MHIKSIIVEGFKSYAQRTEINGFDPLFNAITGLNGSGKSNILDSICFLLGISNLTHVRASNLQDLVYKNGQGGITKATVSITFDNSNKSQSPLGFETHDEITVTRQVVIGGRNKYLINGVNANNTRVQDLFCSVGLNVNNPHFLIMQGRITKVLNMKPPEILAMIEEAAGTRMYECKKISAQKTIEKKEAKLKEIQTVRQTSKLIFDKCIFERSSYLEYQKLMREIQHLSRLYVAWLFVCAEETKVKSAENLKVMQDNIAKMQATMAENESKVQELSAQIQELQKKKDQEVNGVLKSLEEALADVQRVDTKAQSALDLKKQNLKDEMKKKKELVKSMEEDKKMLTVKEKEVSKLAEQLKTLQEEGQKDSAALEAAEQHFKAVSAGLSTNEDGEEATLAGQMMACKNDMSKADTEAKQAQMTLKHAQTELKTKQAEVKKMDSGYKKDQDNFQAVRSSREKLEAELAKLNYEGNGKEESLLDQRRQLSREVAKLKETYERLVSRFPNLRFHYKDPERGWDHSKVKGLLANLITVRDVSYATALEVVAGGRLYNIVVDTEVTGKKLLEKGELQRRYTIIPLNKISAKTLNDKVVNTVGEDNAHTALSLVGYESDLRKAMEYVFGSTLVCDTLDNAKKVAFDKQVMTKTVTLGGDIFDPQGTLSGGARSQSASVLTSLQELKEVQDNLREKEAQLHDTERQLAGLKGTAEKYRQLKQQHELKVEEEQILQAKLQQSSFHQQQEELERLRKAIEESEETLRVSKEVQKRAEEKYKVLENKMKNAEAEREKELKAAQQKLNTAKSKADAFNKKLKQKQQESDAVALELEELRREQTGYEQQIQAVDEAMKAIQEQIDSMSCTVSQNKVFVSPVRKAQEELAKQKEVIMAQDKELKGKSSEANKIREQNNEVQLKIKELEHNISKHRKDSQDAADKVTRMLEEHDWIHSERQFFGQPNTSYDFKTNNPREAGQRLKKLEETTSKLERNVNKRAMNMLNEAEERYNDLMKKKRIVENDKAKILQTIEELDQKKNEALNLAWQKVNKDFGSIFSTLLPGATAKLAPPQGCGVLEGLEFKVALGNTWKENLTELSGGQRSLVALSLILAMLLFKPAPIYILDEVDAALDLSHTQNIGQMLRTHFRHSQFVVVSLKDGMFTNANVLFKTKFVDGMSTVSRTALSQSDTNLPQKGQDKARQKDKRNKHIIDTCI